MGVYKLTLLVLFSVLLTACESNPAQEDAAQASQASSEFRLENLAKTDMDMVYDHNVRVLDQLLNRLMIKLYLRNPAYFRLSKQTAEQRADYLLQRSTQDIVSDFDGKSSVDLIQLAFDENFKGDRVAAFVLGLKSMLALSYNNQSEFFMLDQLDPQKLYNAARNIEVAVWKLSNDRKSDGSLFLISNELQGKTKNLSFERLFGKMIAIQDSSASLNAESTNRVIKNVLQGVAKWVFLPI